MAPVGEPHFGPCRSRDAPLARGRLQVTREGLSTMRVWHPVACGSCARSPPPRSGWPRRRSSPTSLAAAPPPAPDPAWWVPGARLLTLSAAPSRPAVTRFSTGLAGWGLLGPGAVTVRAGGPGGHYAALRDNTTLETPPLAVGRDPAGPADHRTRPGRRRRSCTSRRSAPTTLRTRSASCARRRAGTPTPTTPRVWPGRRCASCSTP